MDTGINIGTKVMTLVDAFESEFRGKKYKIYRFVDNDKLEIYNATNLEQDLELGKDYVCTLAYKNSKIKIISVE